MRSCTTETLSSDTAIPYQLSEEPPPADSPPPPLKLSLLELELLSLLELELRSLSVKLEPSLLALPERMRIADAGMRPIKKLANAAQPVAAKINPSAKSNHRINDSIAPPITIATTIPRIESGKKDVAKRKRNAIITANGTAAKKMAMRAANGNSVFDSGNDSPSTNLISAPVAS